MLVKKMIIVLNIKRIMMFSMRKTNISKRIKSQRKVMINMIILAKKMGIRGSALPTLAMMKSPSPCTLIPTFKYNQLMCAVI